MDNTSYNNGKIAMSHPALRCGISNSRSVLTTYKKTFHDSRM